MMTQKLIYLEVGEQKLLGGENRILWLRKKVSDFAKKKQIDALNENHTKFNFFHKKKTVIFKV
jgi:hypothetical protein